MSIRRTICVLGLAAVTVACADRGDEIDDATRATVIALGDSAAMSLARTLGGRLNAHLANSGPGEAIAFCSEEALVLTDSVSASLGDGWEVKRTTRQTRNPRNAPDSLEAMALERFHEADETDAELGSVVQRTASGDYRYYMPLRVGHMCLGCHGERDGLDPVVRQVLDTRYPADQATGYADGDLRGVIRVTVPATAVR